LNFADVFADLGKGELSLLQPVESKVASDNDTILSLPNFPAKTLKNNYAFCINFEPGERVCEWRL
jgi:hypothetical protein